jgi:hypothetical protein
MATAEELAALKARVDALEATVTHLAEQVYRLDVVVEKIRTRQEKRA